MQKDGDAKSAVGPPGVSRSIAPGVPLGEIGTSSGSKLWQTTADDFSDTNDSPDPDAPTEPAAGLLID
jgi:hypothetical protein